jgi:hypothetical protein
MVIIDADQSRCCATVLLLLVVKFPRICITHVCADYGILEHRILKRNVFRMAEA